MYKRTLILLLCSSILLTGCSKNETSSDVSSSTENSIQDVATSNFDKYIEDYTAKQDSFKKIDSSTKLDEAETVLYNFLKALSTGKYNTAKALSIYNNALFVTDNDFISSLSANPDASYNYQPIVNDYLVDLYMSVLYDDSNANIANTSVKINNIIYNGTLIKLDDNTWKVVLPGINQCVFTADELYIDKKPVSDDFYKDGKYTLLLPTNKTFLSSSDCDSCTPFIDNGTTTTFNVTCSAEEIQNYTEKLKTFYNSSYNAIINNDTTVGYFADEEIVKNIEDAIKSNGIISVTVDSISSSQNSFTKLEDTKLSTNVILTLTYTANNNGKISTHSKIKYTANAIFDRVSWKMLSMESLPLL